MAEVTLTDEEPFVNQNDFNAIDRNRNCSLVCNKIPEGFLGIIILENIQSDLWKTIKDLGEPLVENCSNSRLIYHFEASYFETIESHLNMRQDRISECNIRYVTYHMSHVICHMCQVCSLVHSKISYAGSNRKHTGSLLKENGNDQRSAHL